MAPIGELALGWSLWRFSRPSGQMEPNQPSRGHRSLSGVAALRLKGDWSHVRAHLRYARDGSRVGSRRAGIHQLSPL
jgi:hypothetical protein